MELIDNILLCGCGGGYDIMTCLPTYYKYINNHNIYLANFSLTNPFLLEPFHKICDGLRVIDPQQKLNIKNLNFPEYLLAKLLNTNIYCFYDDGLKNLCFSYDVLTKLLNIKTIILCDSGADSIMTGMEEKIGSIVEDYMNIYSVNQLLKSNKIERAYISCLGIDVESFKQEIYLADILTSIFRLNDNNGIISQELLDIKNDYVKKYVDIFEKSNPQFSTTNFCITAAIKNEKMEDFNIGDLTRTLYIFDFNIVVKFNIFLDDLNKFDDSDDIDEFIIKNKFSQEKE